MATPGARVVLRPRHGGVLGHVRVDVGDLVDLVSDPVDVNAAGVGNLTEVAVPGGERRGLRD